MSQLEAVLSHPSSRLSEVRSAASFLALLAGDCRAASCLLAFHSLQLQDKGAALLKYYSSGEGRASDL